MKEKFIEAVNNFSERERTVLTLFITFMAFFLFAGIWYIMDMSIENRKNIIIEQETLIQKMVSMKTVYKKAQQQREDMKNTISSNNVNLNSDISTVRESTGIGISTLKEMKPRKKGDISIDRIEIGFRDVPLEQVMAFLYGIENRSRFVFIDAITVKKRFNRQNYDVSLVVAALKKEVGGE